MSATAAGEEQSTRASLGFVGAGRAGAALAIALHDVGYRVVSMSSRKPSDARRLAMAVGASTVASPADVLAAADLTFLTVPDREIATVAVALAGRSGGRRGKSVVHCSARLSTDPLAELARCGADTGVLHPLQALAGAESAASLRGAMFRIQGQGRLRKQLEDLVAALGGEPVFVPEGSLDLYHAAAVLAGNAPLALLARAVMLLREAGVPEEQARRGLATLMQGAAANARRQPAARVLTGPVARGDADAVARHLAALDRDPDARRLYLELARAMASLAGVADEGPMGEVLSDGRHSGRHQVA